MAQGGRKYSALLSGVAAAALLAGAGGARAEEVALNIAPQPLGDALNDFAVKSKHSVVFAPGLVAEKTSRGVESAATAELALAQLLDGSGLTYRSNGNTFLIQKADADPQSGSAAGDGAEVEALIVTAQKREEDIQDVPIAISAFTQEQLERSQVAGGPDLMTQVPNMTFTKTNFTGYSIQLRGIGTQAISATVDNAVAVAFNNTPFIRNRFFEQEFYDLQRIEVLRGPQGTLYGRNATAGVVNLISQKPKLETYEAKLSGDVANYNSTRIEGMLNVPLADDKVALRLAGAWTKREGYATNSLTGNPIDGRDLWSTRASLRFAPTDAIDVNLIWEHFEEDDDRIRSGKQLCKTHEVTEITAIFPGDDPTTLNGNSYTMPVTHFQTMPFSGLDSIFAGVQGTFSQGCQAASLYSPESFQTPNGLSLPYYSALAALGFPAALVDPYQGRTQSRDLRSVESMVDPSYRAKADIVELQASFDITDSLTITSETGWSSDFTFSTQDYNRFNTAAGAFRTNNSYETKGILSDDGFFCDPQIGCADRLVAMDLATATSHHFSQELRISSSFDAAFNFSLGGNFLRYDTEDKYYVFINSVSMYSANNQGTGTGPYIPGVSDNATCLRFGFRPPEPDGTGTVSSGCMYLDPNPITNLNDQGHNYFLSRNPYKLISYAVFGEGYYNFSDDLKLTAGLRWTVDKKEAPRVPSWILAVETAGLSVAEVVEQEWNEPTGRLAVDWKPELSFTDQTMVYASYGHGYKAGGMNPPAAGLVCYSSCGSYAVGWAARQAAHPLTFDPEYIDAFEVGAKNTFLDGNVVANLAAFYYNYQDYQLSQIIDRSAVTQNFDAKIWGLEIEADWRVFENLKLGFKGGYEHTEVMDGERAIDIMDRTAGKPGWLVVSPFPTFPSNCVLPAYVYAGFFNGSTVPIPTSAGFPGGGGPGGCELAYMQQFDPVSALPYVPNPTLGDTLRIPLRNQPDGTPYAGFNPLDERLGHNFGEGFYKDLSGNQLPNAPEFTGTILIDYTAPLPNDWLMTLHTDLYYQSEAWWRIFNTPGYDKLKAYTNVNLAAIFTQEELGWKVMAYVKNVFDRDSITGAFLNSDDTGLTTNVFLTEPRIYGLRVTKEWNGGPWWTGANPDSNGPFPLTVEIGGQALRTDAPKEPINSPRLQAVPAAINTVEDVQMRDLDWGDGRSIRVSYKPAGSAWTVSFGTRYGRANGDMAREHKELTTDNRKCIYPIQYNLPQCTPGSAYYTPSFLQYSATTEFSDTAARNDEDYAMADFDVGYDVGIGSRFPHSTVKIGVHYAEFESTTQMYGQARTDFDVDHGWYFYGIGFNNRAGEVVAQREFSGMGPKASWDGALKLLGGDETGHLDVDWSLTGGMLFGKTETSIMGEDSIQGRRTFYSGIYGGLGMPGTAVTPLDVDTISILREESASVNFADVSVGLAYEMQRVKIGVGYRWERYFDVLDVGFDEAEAGDRTIDGPYFKLAVGFGG